MRDGDERPPRTGGDDDVGPRLREYRKLRGATLRTIAQRAGVSEGFLSQLERGRTNASLHTLRRIAAALDLEVGDLFVSRDGPAGRVLTPETRPRLLLGDHGVKQLLTPKPYRHLEIFIWTFEPGGTTGPEPLVHGPSQEVVFVLRGSARLDLGDQSYVLKTGYSVEYDSTTPHLVTALEEGAEVMWVISPPSF